MKGIIKFLAVVMISSFIGLQSANAQIEENVFIPRFSDNYVYEDLASISESAWVNIGVVSQDEVPATEVGEICTGHSEMLEDYLQMNQVSYLENEISNKIDQLKEDFGLEQVQGLRLEMMIDIRGKIAKLEMIDTDMDRQLVRDLLNQIEKWTFNYKLGENTRFSLKVG